MSLIPRRDNFITPVVCIVEPILLPTLKEFNIIVINCKNEQINGWPLFYSRLVFLLYKKASENTFVNFCVQTF